MDFVWNSKCTLDKTEYKVKKTIQKEEKEIVEVLKEGYRKR